MKNQNQSVFCVDVNSLLAILTKYPFGSLVAIIIATVVGLGYGLSQYYFTQQPSVIFQSRQFTRAEYERLRLGMQLVQAEAILGRGIETQHSTTNTIFMWKNSDGSKIIATFINGELTHKEQTGL